MHGPQPSTVVIDEDQLVVMAGINTLLADKSEWTTGAANKHMHEGVSRGKPVVGQGSSKRHKAIPSTPESSDVESVVDANDICVESTSSVMPGRSFLRRLICLNKGVGGPWHHIRLTCESKLDLHAWLLFLDHYQGKSLTGLCLAFVGGLITLTF